MPEPPHVYIPLKNKTISPCPSCGNLVKLFYEDYLCWDEGKTKRVYFMKCKYEDCSNQGPKKDMIMEAVDAWNRMDGTKNICTGSKLTPDFNLVQDI